MVPDRVTVGVVDVFEVIEVEVEQGELAIDRGVCGDGFIETVIEADAVEKPG